MTDDYIHYNASLDSVREAYTDTIDHQKSVYTLLSLVCVDLMERAVTHDESKFMDVEMVNLAKLKDHQSVHGRAKFGTPEYEEQKAMLGPMLDNHYLMNKHHPEHHENGVRDMTLGDVVEMFCDWLAASHRDDDEEPVVNLQFLANKYGIGSPLIDVFKNTCVQYEYRYVDVDGKQK